MPTDPAPEKVAALAAAVEKASNEWTAAVIRDEPEAFLTGDRFSWPKWATVALAALNAAGYRIVSEQEWDDRYTEGCDACHD